MTIGKQYSNKQNLGFSGVRKIDPGNRRIRPDETGRMEFGKYYFERFERVPHDYLRYVRDNVRALPRYPNLKKYIEENIGDE